MKNLLFAVLLLSAFTFQAQQRTYQEGKRNLQKQEMANLTADQRAELHTKKMVLALDLSETQQKKVAKLNEKLEAQREKLRMTKEKAQSLSQEERFNRKNERMDEEIAYHREMKQILTEEQYSKFETMRQRKGLEGKRKALRAKHQSCDGKGKSCDGKCKGEGNQG